jgi:hypothetical protein
VVGSTGVFARVRLANDLSATGLASLAKRQNGALAMELFFILLPIYILFCLWLGYRIVEKAGFDGRWALVLLVPVVNIIMIWVFAFSRWPNLRKETSQDL